MSLVYAFALSASLSLPLMSFAGPARPASTRTPQVMAVASENNTQTASANLKSFKDWKAEKVQSATQQVENTRAQVKALKARNGRTAPLQLALQNLEQQLAQEEWNLEVASDLSVTDYIALYLAQHASSGKLAEAASKLTPHETAQVLEAYIRSMGGFPSDAKGTLPINALQRR